MSTTTSPPSTVTNILFRNSTTNPPTRPPQPPPPPSKQTAKGKKIPAKTKSKKQITKGKKISAKTKSKKRKRTDNTAPTIVYGVSNNQAEVTLSGLTAPVRGYIVRPLEEKNLLLVQLQTKQTKDSRPARGVAHTVSSTADLQVSRIIALPSSAVAPLTKAIYKRRRIDVAREKTKNNKIQSPPELLSFPDGQEWKTFALPNMKDKGVYTYTSATQSEEVVTMGHPLNKLTVNVAMARFLHTDCMYRVVRQGKKKTVRRIEFLMRSRSVVKTQPPQSVQPSLFHFPQFSGQRSTSTSINNTELTQAAMFGVQEPWIRVRARSEFLRLLQTATNNVRITKTSSTTSTTPSTTPFENTFRDALSKYLQLQMTPRPNKSMRIVFSNCQKTGRPDWSTMITCTCGLNGSKRCEKVRKQQQQARLNKKKKKRPKKKVATIPTKNVKQPSARVSFLPPTYDLITPGDSEHASQLHALLLPFFRNVALLAKGHKSSSFTKVSVIDCTVLPDGGVASIHEANAREVILIQLHSLVLAVEKKFQEQRSSAHHSIAELGKIWVGCKSAHNRSYLVFLLAIQKIVKDSSGSVGAFSYSDAHHFAGEYQFERITDALPIFKELATEAKHRELWGCYVEWGVLDNFVNTCVQ